jgi:hypothetical protein
MHIPDIHNEDDVTVTSELSDDDDDMDVSSSSLRPRKILPPLPLIDWYYDAHPISIKLYNELHPTKTPLNSPIKCKKNKSKTTSLATSLATSLETKSRTKVIPLDLSNVQKYDDDDHVRRTTDDKHVELERILREQLMEELREQLMEPRRHQETQPSPPPHVSYTSMLSRGWVSFRHQTLGFLKKTIV